MDTLANLFTTIRNAYAVRKEEIIVPTSNLNRAVATVLKREGYLSKVTEQKDETTGRPVLTLELRYNHQMPALSNIRRISRPGRRVYVAADRLPRPIGGVGTIIISTPAGIVTGAQAKKQNLGGEVLCEILRGEA